MPPGQVWGHLPLFETLGTLVSGKEQRKSLVVDGVVFLRMGVLRKKASCYPGRTQPPEQKRLVGLLGLMDGEDEVQLRPVAEQEPGDGL